MDFDQSTQNEYAESSAEREFMVVSSFLSVCFIMTWLVTACFFLGLSTAIRNYMELWLHPLMLAGFYGLKPEKHEKRLARLSEIPLIKSIPT